MEPSFWDQHGDEISAAITLAVAFVIAFAIDRFLLARARRLAVQRGVSRTAQTRLQVVRRLVFLTILVIGIALALSQFAQIKRLATGILASSAVIGIVIGFAARQSIANLVAGVMLAITQPIRIGDRVTFAEETGRIADLTLSYTYIDTGDGRLMVVPNDMMVTDVVFNHSTGDQSAPVTVSVWVPPDADLGSAHRALEAAGAAEVSVAEMSAEGVRLEVKASIEGEPTRVGGEEAALRERTQTALREAGLLEELRAEPPA